MQLAASVEQSSKQVVKDMFKDFEVNLAEKIEELTTSLAYCLLVR